MALLSGWVEEARRSYCAYGADFIRTGCLLLRTTPSLAYRAAVLFQRFQAVAEEVRWKRGDYDQENTCSEKNDDFAAAATLLGVTSYTVPAHVGTERPSGIIAFGDPYAPLDYCVFHLMEHDDITYLTAACVLIAAKIEDPSTRIRFIIGVFMRLNQRRRGEPVIELLQPPPERYDDFKLCVIEAEEVVLQALGFQTFVECPFKYTIFFLGLLVEGDEADAGGEDDNMLVAKQNFSSDCFASIALKKWLADAVCWLNDIPRSIDLYNEEAHVLALCALVATRPTNISGLPDEWTLAFGLEKSKLNAVLRLHKKHLEDAVSSEENNIRLLIATGNLKPYYPTAATPTPTPTQMAISATATEKNMTVEESVPGLTGAESKGDVVGSLQREGQAAVHPVLSSVHVPIPYPDNVLLVVPPAMAPLNVLGTFPPALHHNLVAGGNQVANNSGGVGGGSSSSGGVVINNNSAALQLERQRGGSVLENRDNAGVVAGPQIEEEFYFEDLKEMRRRRRQEEEEEEKQRRKRRRSSSRRRRHRSGDGHRHRSSSRRREGSRGGKRRRHQSTEHLRGSRRDDDKRRHHDDRHRHDDRKRQSGKQRRNGKSSHH